MADPVARVELKDRRFAFAGALLRPALAGLWPVASTAAGIDAIDLTGVDRIDSAGIALVGWLADRHPRATLVGTPAGYEELRAAYRLDDRLRFER